MTDDRRLTDEELDELLACYAIDALDADERALVDARLANDLGARRRLAELESAAALGAVAFGAPEEIWDRIAPVVAADAGATPIRRGPQWVRRAAAVAAAVVVLGAGIGIGTTLTGGDDVTSIERAADVAATAPGSRSVVLEGIDGRAQARAVVLRDGSGYLTSELPALPSGRTYQLWAVVDDGTVSLGVLGRDPGTRAFTLASPATTLAVTEEVAGGVAESHNPPRASGELPAV